MFGGLKISGRPPWKILRKRRSRGRIGKMIRSRMFEIPVRRNEKGLPRTKRSPLFEIFRLPLFEGRMRRGQCGIPRENPPDSPMSRRPCFAPPRMPEDGGNVRPVFRRSGVVLKARTRIRAGWENRRSDLDGGEVRGSRIPRFPFGGMREIHGKRSEVMRRKIERTFLVRTVPMIEKPARPDSRSR